MHALADVDLTGRLMVVPINQLPERHITDWTHAHAHACTCMCKYIVLRMHGNFIHIYVSHYGVFVLVTVSGNVEHDYIISSSC